MTRSTAMLGLLLALALTVTDSAHALRRAMPWRLETAVALPAAVAPDVALVVTAHRSERPGPREPRRIRVVGPDGTNVPVRVEELVYGLHRISPRRRLEAGTYRVTGLGGTTSLRVRARSAASLAAPAIVQASRTTTPANPARPDGPQNTRVMIRLRSIPAGAMVLVARWADWTDAEGGIYGAFTTEIPTVAAGTPADVRLTCSEADECPRGGHIPRANERGEFRFLDAEGRMSPVTVAVVP